MAEIITDTEKLTERSDEIHTGKENGFMRKIILDLKQTIRDTGVSSLSAPQIGYQKRIFAIKFDRDVKSFINPIITNAEGLQLVIEECPSLPGRRFIRPRNQRISVMYQTPLGKTESRTLVGMAAFVFQHELDHLDGILLDLIGAEVDENYENMSEEEKAEFINAYKDSLDLKTKEINDLVKEDSVSSSLNEIIEFNTAVQKGEVEFEKQPTT